MQNVPTPTRFTNPAVSYSKLNCPKPAKLQSYLTFISHISQTYSPLFDYPAFFPTLGWVTWREAIRNNEMVQAGSGCDIYSHTYRLDAIHITQPALSQHTLTVTVFE